MPANEFQPVLKFTVETATAVPPETPLLREGVAMSVKFKFARFAAIVALCLFSLSLASADSTHSQHKPKKPAPKAAAQPLPSGPTGPIENQVPLDSIPPVPPQVTFQDGQLTIVAPNSTLGDVLRAVHKLTGAEIDIPEAKERVATRVGPGPARDVMAELLNGSRFDYVLLGSAEDQNALTRVVLVAKSPPDNVGAAGQPAQPAQPGGNQAARVFQAPPPDMNDSDTADQSVDDSAEQVPAEPETPANVDQPEVKTPQQMLQEMQQRQLQLQQQLQQQQTGQPVPIIPPRN